MRLFWIFLFIVSQNLNSNNCCVCQIGLTPKKEQSIFRIGCKTWSKIKKCSNLEIIFDKENILPQLENCKKDPILISYVGHNRFSKYSEIKAFIFNQIVPIINKFNLPVIIDETSCKSHSFPNTLSRYLNSLNIDKNSYIKYIGNQTNSSGIWNYFLNYKTNFYAISDSRSMIPTYPNCNEFENKSCIQSIQKSDKGICVDINDKIQILECNLDLLSNKYIWQKL